MQHGASSIQIQNSTLDHNSADSGGCIFNESSSSGRADLIIASSTLSGNSARDGAALFEDGENDSPSVSVLIASSTVAGNSASGTYYGGGIYVVGAGAIVEIANTVLEAGTMGANVVNATGYGIESLGYNLCSDTGGYFLNAIGDRINTDAMLGPLQDNGGPTWTHALLPGSPAIDAGTNFLSTSFDQRGPNFVRTFDDPSIANAPGGDGTDIGAFEVQAPPNLPPVAVIQVSPLFSILPGNTNLFVLAPNNVQAMVVLDGSQSSDADHDSLQFSWYADGHSDLLATGAFVTKTFPVGPHVVTLVVNDGRGATATAQVSFQIIPPSAAVGQLLMLVDRADLGRKNKQPLLASLVAAMASFDRGRFNAGVNQLEAFEHKVSAQVARSDPALAQTFIQAAQEIIDALPEESINR